MRRTAVFLTSLALAVSTAFAADAVTGASQKVSGNAPVQVDVVTSASIVPQSLRTAVPETGFTNSKKPKILIVAADPRLDHSVQGALTANAAKFFIDRGCEVVLRDLYRTGFDPILRLENFYNAKDGAGSPDAKIAAEQEWVKKADIIVFSYPNWHDTPTPMAKGYMERVFAKKFAYRDTEKGLEGLLRDKAFYTIMNAGWMGQGQGFVGDGLNRNKIWDKYMGAFRVLDEDTAGFWGMKTLGRFCNDQTPANADPAYGEKLQALFQVENERLARDFRAFFASKGLK